MHFMQALTQERFLFCRRTCCINMHNSQFRAGTVTKTKQGQPRANTLIIQREMLELIYLPLIPTLRAVKEMTAHANSIAGIKQRSHCNYLWVHLYRYQGKPRELGSGSNEDTGSRPEASPRNDPALRRFPSELPRQSMAASAIPAASQSTHCTEGFTCCSTQRCWGQQPPSAPWPD